MIARRYKSPAKQNFPIFRLLWHMFVFLNYCYTVFSGYVNIAILPDKIDNFESKSCFYDLLWLDFEWRPPSHAASISRVKYSVSFIFKSVWQCYKCHTPLSQCDIGVWQCGIHHKKCVTGGVWQCVCDNVVGADNDLCNFFTQLIKNKEIWCGKVFEPRLFYATRILKFYVKITDFNLSIKNVTQKTTITRTSVN